MRNGEKGYCRRPDEREAVRQLALKGMSIREIALALEISYDRSKNHITMLFNAGVIPPAAQRKRLGRDEGQDAALNAERVRRQVRYGSMLEVLRGLDMKQVGWVLDQVPKGGTVADIMRALIVDAYEEEMEK